MVVLLEKKVVLVIQLLVLFAANAAWAADGDGYYGKYIGKLKTLHHGVSGEVYAVDARTLHIRNFNYDGEGPAAYFYGGDSKSPNSNGFRINDEKGSPNVLPKYRNKHITLTLPENKTLRDIRWFSVWCDEFSVNFGDVRISKTFEYPRPQKIDALGGVHGVSSENIVVVDAQTLLIPSFSYDGEAPDAKFWVGRGSKPSPQGLRVPDENGKEVPLRRYDRKTIVLTMPGDLTVYDIGHFGVWCEAFTVDFGHVRIPRALNVPPSLKMLGVSPQSKLNCEVLLDENAFEVRWAVAGDSVVIQLVGKIDDGEYMSFGLSGDDTRSKMVGGDVAVVWVNHSSLAGDARDYFLDSKSQCAGTRGSCPDQRLREGTNSIRLLNAAMVNGYSIVTYQRPLHAKDELDRAILTNGSQPIVWALGPLNSRNEVSYHRVANRHDVLIDFARSPKWNCPIPDSEGGAASNDAPASSPTPTPSRGRPTRPQSSSTHDAASGAAANDERPSSRRPTSRQPSSSSSSSRAPATPAPAPSVDAWDIPPIQCYEPEDGVFYAQMGPTGGKHGYPAITGHVGWGISWYINGLLIPEINVVRGKTYTFIVEGGHDPETPARYHPFYITDDPVGGYEYKTAEERARVRVFAGVRVNRRGEAYPTGTGRLCNWTPDPAQPPADEFASFGAYQRTLSLECEVGNPGVVEWTPDDNTPDTVYYQCYTHRYLGWKINVHDSCEAAALAASEPVAAQVPADQSAADDSEEVEEGELQSRPSIRVATRVKPEGVIYSGDKDLATSYQSFSSAATSYTTSSGVNQVGEVYLPPAALQQDAQSYALSPGQQYIPLTDQSEDDNVFTVQPDTGAEFQAHKQHSNGTADIILNQTPATEVPIKPSPIDIVNPGTAQQAQESAAQPSINTFNSFNSVPNTTPDTILPVDASKTTNVKLLSSTARPAATNDHTVIADSDLLDGIKPTSEVSPLVTPTFVYKRPIIHRPHGLAPHGYILPNGRPASLASHTMMLHRPQPYSVNPYRRPIPHRGYVPLHRPAASIIRPTYISTPLPPNYLMTSKKPFYRVTMMTIPHRTMVSPSPYHRPLTTLTPRPIIPAQQQFASSFKNMYSLPPQRIKYDKLQAIASTINSPTLKPNDVKNTIEAKMVESATKTIPIISPAPLLSTSTESISLNMPVAINTGFRPETVVVEGGFKPIIKNIAQDRSSVEIDTEFVDQDEIIDKLEKEALEGITEKTDVGEDRKDNPFKGQQPETFEPMFIPSPPDRVNQNSTDVDDLKPPAVSSQKLSQKVSSRVRPSGKRPVYPVNGASPVRIPLRPASPSFRYQQSSDETPGEVAMAAERMDTYYLPPSGYQTAKNPPSVDSTIPPGAVVAYDGKSVVDVSLASSISDPSASTSSNYQSPSGTAELIKGTPQFGPYRGDIPPPVPKVVHPESIPQLQNRNKQHSSTLPLQFNQRSNYYSQSTPNTRLTVVEGQDLSSAGSEAKELYTVYESKQKGSTLREKAAFKKTSPIHENTEEITSAGELYTTLAMNEETTTRDQIGDVTTNVDRQRNKRAAVAHHEPGHTGTADDHDHSQHDHSSHSHHDHSDHPDHSHSETKDSSKGNGSTNHASVFIPTVFTIYMAIGFHLTRYIF